METLRFKKAYLLISIPLIAIFFILLFSIFFMKDKWMIYYMGVIDRIILGIWCVFNGIWNSFTDYYSILKNNMYQRNKTVPRWGWLLLLVLGLGCIITALMGYGFNNVSKPI